jgi:hypothetical protein
MVPVQLAHQFWPISTAATALLINFQGFDNLNGTMFSYVVKADFVFNVWDVCTPTD